MAKAGPGRLRREEQALPPAVLTGLTLAANGSSWSEAAEAVGMTAPTLRKWHRDPRAAEFVQTVVRENLDHANSVLANAAPALATALVKIGLDESVKPYARISAIDSAFKVIGANILDQEQRKQLQQIRGLLHALEQGSAEVVDV